MTQNDKTKALRAEIDTKAIDEWLLEHGFATENQLLSRLVNITGWTREEFLAHFASKKAEADAGLTIDVTGWTEEQIAERFFSDGPSDDDGGLES
jgi:hypothetical protein